MTVSVWQEKQKRGEEESLDLKVGTAYLTLMFQTSYQLYVTGVS